MHGRRLIGWTKGIGRGGTVHVDVAHDRFGQRLTHRGIGEIAWLLGLFGMASRQIQAQDSGGKYPHVGQIASPGLVSKPRRTQSVVMFNVISILIGFVALLLAIPSFLPFLGWGNWLVVPIAIVGLIFGVFSSHNSGRNFNIVVILIGVGRLMLGGGFF